MFGLGGDRVLEEQQGKGEFRSGLGPHATVNVVRVKLNPDFRLWIRSMEGHPVQWIRPRGNALVDQMFSRIAR